MRSSSWGWCEEAELSVYHFDTQALLPAADDVDRGQLATLDTLQYRLA